MSETLIKAHGFAGHFGGTSRGEYDSLYRDSITDPDAFWSNEARRLDWMEPWKTVKNTRFEPDVSIAWFEGAKLNACVNCVDRHAAATPDKAAIVWEGDNPAESRTVSYRELKDQVCKLANVMVAQGVKKGDRVTVYLPMIPEAAYAMLACARIGAVHSLVFAGFSPESLGKRISDCESDFIITADEGLRGGKTVPLKANLDEALKPLAHKVRKVLVVKRTGGKVEWNPNRDRWYHEEMVLASAQHAPEAMEAEDPLFILYTSGSTGAPKGVVHTTAGYLLYAAFTHEKIFGYREGDVYWCTADVGWVTGHSYVVYGPLCNGATTVMFEGVPHYPDPSRFWQVVDKYKVNLFYTAPTALRALMHEGDDYVTCTSRASLKLLASVGEPINPEAWLWYYTIVGEKRCPVIDTWWQTETGGIMIAPIPSVTDLKPGSATLPFYGVEPVILDRDGKVLEGECEGMLCLAEATPGMARTIYGDHARFFETYFSRFKGYYFTGDGCRRDKDGYYWISGRVDDVINVSGHRLGTAEIEGALAAHKDVSEAAVVGVPHDIKGQGIYAYVVLAVGAKGSDALTRELRQWARTSIGPIATPDYIHIAPALPKTRSGKIMRRILRKIAHGETEGLGDISTLANPEIVAQLIQARANASPPGKSALR